MCYVKYKNYLNFVNKIVEINVIDKCFLSDELGFMIGSVIVKIR